MTRPIRPAQELKIHAAILRIVGERGLGHRPIAEVTTTDVAAMAHAAWRTLPAARPVEVTQPGKSAKAREARKAALERETEPTVPAAGSCHLACPEVPVGWRLYVHEGWRPVCSRHMGGAKAVGIRFNRDLGVTEAGR